jgi:hypothetical protein
MLQAHQMTEKASVAPGLENTFITVALKVLMPKI